MSTYCNNSLQHSDSQSANKKNSASTKRHFSSGSVFTLFFSLFSLVMLVIGWLLRDEYLLSADVGLGYALGIIGGSMMLLLLMYPLKKRFQNKLVFIISTKNWFKLHMILGVLGPLLILYHCNFSLGSTNSNIALFSMLLMVSSGLIGRFLYSKIHYGLYGKKIELGDLIYKKLAIDKKIANKSRNAILISENLRGQLVKFEKTVLEQKSVFGAVFSIIKMAFGTRINYRNLVKTLRQDQKNNQPFLSLNKNQQYYQFNQAKKDIADYLAIVRKIASLNFFERLFSLWHILHLPIFFMLILTGFIHVYAVHMY